MREIGSPLRRSLQACFDAKKWELGSKGGGGGRSSRRRNEWKQKRFLFIRSSTFIAFGSSPFGTLLMCVIILDFIYGKNQRKCYRAAVLPSHHRCRRLSVVVVFERLSIRCDHIYLRNLNICRRRISIFMMLLSRKVSQPMLVSGLGQKSDEIHISIVGNASFRVNL